MKKLICVAVLLVLLLPACNDKTQTNSNVSLCENAQDLPFDNAIKDAFRAGLEKLKKDDGTATLVDLIKQLDRKTCNIKLSEAGNEKLDPVEIYEKCKQSTVIVGKLYKCNKCTKWHISTASGYMITASGVMVTNYHVIDQKDKDVIGAMTYDGKVYGVKEILAANKKNDYAIVQLHGSGFTPLALAAEALVGTKAFVISHPDSHYYLFTEGMVSRQFMIDKPGGHRIHMMSITADYARGSSGGPVFNEYGAVIGMVRETTSLYYNKNKRGVDLNLQMVLKNCVPASVIMQAIKEE